MPPTFALKLFGCCGPCGQCEQYPHQANFQILEIAAIALHRNTKLFFGEVKQFSQIARKESAVPVSNTQGCWPDNNTQCIFGIPAQFGRYGRRQQ